ncbi:hypothetical protein ACFQ0B_27035 [Nonomuraea thailandensis]
MNAELYVLPLVVRIERAGSDPGPPERTDALEAAAMAVLALLDDPGEFAEELRAWQSTGKIRKVVRRARGPSGAGPWRCPAARSSTAPPRCACTRPCLSTTGRATWPGCRCRAPS